MENESNYSDGSGRQTEEEDSSAVADRHRAQQTETRRQAYQRIASPPGGRAYQASYQSQDLDDLHEDARDIQPKEAQYGMSISGDRGSGRLDRHVSMPVDLAIRASSSTDFGGFSRDGRQGAPSPVPFRGMTPGGGISLSTPMAAAAGPPQSVSASGRFVAFQTQPPGTHKIGDSLISFSTGRGASVANTTTASGTGSGSSILDRTAYLSARRSTILSKALSAGWQQQQRGNSGGM